MPIAWATMRPAPLPELARPARSRSPAITGAEPGVLIVVASGDVLIDPSTSTIPGSRRRTVLGGNGSSEAQADVAAALLDALEVERVAVVGISAGGHAAIQFAARHPERTRALVLLSAASRRTPLSDAPAEQRPRSPDDDPQVPKPGVFPDPRRAARPQFSGDALGPGQLSPAGSARWPQG